MSIIDHAAFDIKKEGGRERVAMTRREGRRMTILTLFVTDS